MKSQIFSLVFILSLVGSIYSQNNALAFNGQSNNVELAFSPLLDFGNSDSYSVEMWFKSTIGTSELVSNIINNIPAKGIVIGLTGGCPYFYMGNAVYSDWLYVTSTTAYNDGNWHHLAVTYNGSGNANGMRMYVDGSLQTVVVNANTLSTTPMNSGASFNIGSRNNFTYYYSGSLDELRFWGKTLCLSEIVARKNCALNGNEPQLLAYYNFNQGTAGGSNLSVTSLPNINTASITGTLSGFALSGTISNWVTGATSVSGICNYSYVNISGNQNICAGSSTTLTASGATSYSWNLGQTNPSIVLSPTVATNYTLTTTAAGNCFGVTIVGVNIVPNPTVQITANTNTICPGQSLNLYASGAASYLWSTSATSSVINVSPLVSIIYTVTGTNAVSGCSSLNSFFVNVSKCTGIEKNSTDIQNLIIFPNPGNGRVSILSQEDVELYITNETGQLVKVIFLNSNNNHIETIQNLSAGLYFVKAKEFALVQKLIITN